MKLLARKTVLEYKYESEEDAKKHEETMKRDGWQREAVGHLMIPHFRSYSQRHKEGMFI